MANLTLSVDDAALERARARARAMGTSVNQMVRDLIERIANTPDVEGAVSELRRLSDLAQGHSGGTLVSRDKLHDRS